MLNTDEAAPFIGKAIEGAVLGSYSFDRYKKEKADLDKTQFNIVGLKAHDAKNRHYLSRYTAVSQAVNEARDMINEPGSVATPEYLAEAARNIAKESDLDLKIWDEKKLRKDGYNGLLQVGRGSAYPPRMIRLAYRTGKAKGHLAFVGKGITFDTGGISLKPADKMFEMKGDMSGGAAVLYAMKAIGKLKPDVNVTGIVPTAENFPDANAQRPGDIFYAKNGKSIMVDNTDAEGRLILTDGLHLAGEEKATHILDIATLTGAQLIALGPRIMGVMGNDDGARDGIVDAARRAGEAAWPMPLPEELRKGLDSTVADIANVAAERNGGMLVGGLFLKEFVPNGVRWAHLDIAGPAFHEGEPYGYVPKGGTGAAVRSLVQIALDVADGRL